MDWYELLPKILNMSLTASVIIVTVLILRVLLRRAPRIYSYMLWAVVLFRLLCPITINTPLSVLGLFDTPIVETTDSVSQVAYIPNNIVHTENPEVTLPVPVLDNAINNALPQGAEQLVADPLEAPVSIATYIWLAGIVAMIGVSMISYVKLRKSESSPNLCVHSSSSYVSPSMLPLSSGDLIEWSLVCHSILSYQKFCD